jgi:hypothetical protein
MTSSKLKIDLLKVMVNLLRYPPVEGSIASHEAWKENLRNLLEVNWHGNEALWTELFKPGYISLRCRNLAASYLTLLTSQAN